MEDLNIVYLSSPPSSLQEKLLLRNNSIGSKMPHQYLSSTPKTDSHNSMSNLYMNISNSHGNERNLRNYKLLQNFDVTSDIIGSPNTNGDSDNSDECDANLPTINKHPKYSDKKFMSQSLPVTPRVNGQPKNVNGTLDLSNMNVASPINFNISQRDHSLFSPHSSQYITCPTTFDESVPKALQGSIDYSSLPLPKETSVCTHQKKNISRYSSEPTINDMNQPTVPGSTRKSYLRSRKRNSKDSSSVETSNERQIRTSFNGIEEKLDELEMIGTQWKFIRTLVDELNKCRAQNNRLAVQLQQTKLELQAVKASKENSSDTLHPSTLSDLLCQIHAAQKVRDESMMARITLANEERDAALLQTQGLMAKLGHPDPLYQSNYVEQRSVDEGLSVIEEELKSFRIAINEQESQEKQKVHVHLAKELEDLKEKFAKNEMIRINNQSKHSDRHSESRLTNGFHDPKTPLYSSGRMEKNFEDKSESRKDSSLSDDPKNSMSSLDSVETISVSSWRREGQNSFSSTNESGAKETCSSSKSSIKMSSEGSPKKTTVDLVGPITEL